MNQPLQPWRWLVLPAVLCVVLTLLLATPVRVFGFGLPEPVLPLALAFAWPVIRPSFFGPVVLLAIGLFLDLLWGGALGMWALCLILVYLATVAARSLILGQDTPILAMWYVAAVLLAFFTAYVITALDTHVAPSLLAVGIDVAFTAALFPGARWLIEHFEDADIRFR